MVRRSLHAFVQGVAMLNLYNYSSLSYYFPGPVDAFLSWSPFTVLGRLTYSGYLIQMAVLVVVLENLEQPVLLNVFSVVGHVSDFCFILIVDSRIAV